MCPLYSRSNYLYLGIGEITIMSNDGAKSILAAVLKRDPLSVVTVAYKDLNGLLILRRGPSEIFRNFERRFAAQCA